MEIGDYGYWDTKGTQAWIVFPCRASSADDDAEPTMAHDEQLRFRRVMKILKLGKGFKLTQRQWLKEGEEPEKEPGWPTAKGKWPKVVNMVIPPADEDDRDDEEEDE